MGTTLSAIGQLPPLVVSPNRPSERPQHLVTCRWVEFIDPTGVDHRSLGVALNKALYNYMYGIGLDEDVRSWFSTRVRKTRVPRNFIAKSLQTSA